jgi:general L-amino acid transport system substrate-binding protein
MQRWILGCLITLALPLAAHAATIDRVRSEGVLHCGAPVRPGLAWPARDDSWHGLEFDMCRAIAVAVLGKEAKIDFHGYGLSKTYDAIRNGTDEVFFLTASEILTEHLLPSVVPVVPVFYSTDGVLVLDSSPAHHMADLEGKQICAEPGTGPERSLVAWSKAHKFNLNFFMFEEADEMQDAFYAGRCAAIVHHASNLAALSLQAEADGHPSRFLPESLSAVPIFANTGRGDASWAALVAWTVNTVLRAETIGQPGPGGGAEPLPLAGPDLGLAKGWQDQVLVAVGSYADIYKRNLGSDSPLNIPRGLNALWTDGGIMCPPFSE